VSGRCAVGVHVRQYYVNPVLPEAESVRAPVLSVRGGGGGGQE